MKTNKIPCIAQPTAVCEGCTLKDKLMCRYKADDTTHFFMIILPFFVTVASIYPARSTTYHQKHVRLSLPATR
jgi:hypothetical protein